MFSRNEDQESEASGFLLCTVQAHLWAFHRKWPRSQPCAQAAPPGSAWGGPAREHATPPGPPDPACLNDSGLVPSAPDLLKSSLFPNHSKYHQHGAPQTSPSGTCAASAHGPTAQTPTSLVSAGPAAAAPLWPAAPEGACGRLCAWSRPEGFQPLRTGTRPTACASLSCWVL